MLFDTFIIFFLLWGKTRWLAYVAVVVFHTLTGILFQIGVFPLVMILAVTIFFSDDFHQKLIRTLASLGGKARAEKLFAAPPASAPAVAASTRTRRSWALPLLGFFFLFQLLFPWRYLLYPGNLFWTEEGYRFSWRVMLMEKAGTATFFVKDGPDGREGSVRNADFLNPHQEKQMAMQPDMILQYAHFLAGHFREAGMTDPKVRAEVWVTLNARPARLLIDPNLDLTQVQYGWRPKTWVLPFEEPKE
jgi:hypothetical protein